MTHNEVSALEESPKLQLTLRNHTGTLKAEKERKVTIFYNIFFLFQKNGQHWLGQLERQIAFGKEWRGQG